MPLGNVKEIRKVKELLETLQKEGTIRNWELPYENILTRLDAAIFFLTLTVDENMLVIEERLQAYGNVNLMKNDLNKMSLLELKMQITNK